MTLRSDIRPQKSLLTKNNDLVKCVAWQHFTHEAAMRITIGILIGMRVLGMAPERSIEDVL